MTTEDVRDKIKRGDYETPYPSAKGQPKPLVREARLRWKVEEDKLRAQFQADALAAVGLSAHPKADRIFWYAYERGHASGYEEVLSVLDNLSELFEGDA